MYARATRRFMGVLVMLVVWSITLPSRAIAEDRPPTLKILFLGDRGHHHPADRFRQLQPVLAQRGIELTYSEDPAQLTPSGLANYDGLVLYANIDRIEEPQAKALLDFVAGGKGFIPLHCASYCFRNNDAVVALIGGQFLRHGTGVFRVGPTSAAADHPVMRGYSGFESWDESYVHARHNEQNRTVLEYRVDDKDGSREPWTWVRTHGKGRVFYTAWGHDERTWSNPGFQNLVERGIRWACSGDPAVAGSFTDRPAMKLPRTDVRPFEYVDAVVPFYGPGGKRSGADGPAVKLQQPLPPEESLKHMVTPVGFHVELFAAEPQIGKPVAMNWDERGRLWLCETLDYPNELQPPGTGHDRIRICEDTDGDGRADRFTIFADKLSIPTSLTFYRGGVIVQDGVETLYLKDLDGDDCADVREVLMTGWGMGDTHGEVSNFQYGLDNWIWAMQGYNNSQPQFPGSQGQTFRQGFFRFRLSQIDPPRVTDLEFVRSTNNNTWGLGISEEGLIFGSTANGNPSEYMPIPNRYYERVRGWSPEVLHGIADSNKFEPITSAVRQVDHHGGFTAAAGHALYTARQWPQEYWNRRAFVAEPTGHLVATFQLTGSDASFRSRNAFNILAGDDEWIAPIMAEIGPDGQLWVIDWYNIIVQHNPTPVGYQTGKGNAYEIALRDKTHGRIYRVIYDQSPARTAPQTLRNATLAQLLAALECDNFLWRRHAQRLLVERGAKTDNLQQTKTELARLAHDTTLDPIGLNVGAIHALQALSGLGLIGTDEASTAAVLSALRHPSAGVRRNAAQLVPRTEAGLAALLSATLLDDPDGQVRLAALLAVADMPPSANAAQEVFRVATNSRCLADHWIADACTAAAAAHALPFLTAVLTHSDAPAPEPLVTIVAEHFGRGAPPDIEALMGTLAAEASRGSGAAPAKARDAVLAGLAKGWPKRSPASISPATEAQLAVLLKQLSPAAKGSLLTLAAAWNLKSLESQLAAIAAEFLVVAGNESLEADQRQAAARQYIELRRSDPAAAAGVLKLISPRTPPEAARGLVEAVGQSEAAATGPALVERFVSFTPALRGPVLRVLLSRGDWTSTLLDAVDQGTVPLADLALDQKQALAAHPTRSLAERAKKILARGGGLPNADRQKVLTELLPLAQQTGDPQLGKEIFKKNCSKCHMHGGEGNKVGPDLTGMAVHPKQELLVHVIDPSRNVEGNFRVYTVQLADGRVLSGLLVAESQTSIEVVDAEAKHHFVQRADIDELVASPKSLMPEGFEKQLTATDLVNLLEFLTQRGRFLPIPLDKAATAVSTVGMFYRKDADVERLIFDDWGPKTFAGVPFQLVDPRGDRLPNVVLLHSDRGPIPQTMPRSVSLLCNAPAKAVHLLSGVGGWSFPASPAGSVSLIVRLHYADGQTEDHELVNGRHFADYIRRVDVPDSRFAFALRGQQVRYLAVYPKRPDKIESIELLKGPDRTAPVVMAVTIEAP